MPVVLGPNRYGKAETRLVRVTRDGDVHRLRDLNVSVALSGDLADVHVSGDNANVLPTDSQKNTVYAFAKEHGVASPEEFGLLLARHFTESQAPITSARVAIEEYGWNRTGPHSFVRGDGEVRTTLVQHDETGPRIVSGLKNLVACNTAGSEFHGFARDPYTTLAETEDRILATAVSAAWRYAGEDADWDKSYADARRSLIEAFADTYSYSLQQTLYAMGERVLAACPGICEVRLSLPNKHHFAVDLSAFGLSNDNEVFFAADRPYGLIQGTVLREGAPDAGDVWSDPWSF